MKTCCGTQPRASRWHLPALEAKSLTHSNLVGQITFHAFASQSIWGCEGPGAHPLFLQLGLHWWPWHWGCCHFPGHWGFLSDGLWVSHTIPYHHKCILTTLSQLCICILYGQALQQRSISSP